MLLRADREVERNMVGPQAPNILGSAPIADYQLLISAERPEAPSTYRVADVGGLWLASDEKLPITVLIGQQGERVGLVVGFAYSALHGDFLEPGEIVWPQVIDDVAALETNVLPLLSGLYVFITLGEFPLRLYMDHGGSLPIVYSPADHRAASSTALLFDEADYRARFRKDLHEALIGREGAGGWISGTLTAHRGVERVLPNHYLDLTSWTAHRFWPRRGDFDEWRPFEPSVVAAAKALADFSAAANRRFRVAATMTAGFDSRLLLASCRASLSDCQFFTLEAPNAEMDIHVSRAIAARFGLRHQVLPLRGASEEEMAIWDRMVGDCMIEAPRRTHTTLRDLADRDAVFTGMYGEVGRCRLYRQDLNEINETRIDPKFIVDRLTLPANRELIENIALWFDGLAGQPNSVVLDLAFHELKFGSWAMGQRPISNSIKLNFLPFAQRPVLDAFLGVAPAEKGTDALFSAIINELWPELLVVPINKYGDARDYLTLWKKLSNPSRVRRFLRDRLARKAPSTA